MPNTRSQGHFDLFYIPPPLDESPRSSRSGDGTKLVPEQNVEKSPRVPGQARQEVNPEKTTPVPLMNTKILTVVWDPRTLEGLMSLECTYPEVKDELLIIKDNGALLLTYSQSGSPGEYNKSHEVVIFFERIIRDKYYMRETLSLREAISLDVSGRVIIG